MRGAETVNDEFEVGFNQSFESCCYRTEQAERVAMVAVVGAGPAWIVVFENGAFNQRRLTRLRLTKQDVMAAARQRGLMRLEQVRYAVAERDGNISIARDEG